MQPDLDARRADRLGDIVQHDVDSARQRAGADAFLLAARRTGPTPDAAEMCDAAVVRELFAQDATSLERFLTRWYGQPARPIPPAQIDVDGAPAALSRWFELAAYWTRPIANQDRALPPNEQWDDAGKWVFYVENQGVWLAGFEPGDSDPEVFARENEDYVRWAPTGFHLSEFLLRAAVFEAVLRAQRGACAAWVTEDQLREVLEPMRAIPGPPWPMPELEHRLYAAPDLLAYAGPNPGPDETAATATMYDVFVAATPAGRIDYLRSVPGVDWDQLTT